jgi:hypothetical protein
MRSGIRRRSLRAPEPCRCRHLSGVVIILFTGLLAAACTTTGQSTFGLAVPNGATVAFESIDGAPPAVFQKLVQTLSEEAASRAVPVVSRRADAEYRIRGYLAAHGNSGTTTFAWVWDVYDHDQNRALRITGEQSAATSIADASGAGAWAASNEQVLRGIARASMERVATFLRTSGPTPASAPPGEQTTSAVARASLRDDFSPEAWSIVRILRVSNTSAAAAAMPPADVPLPRRRPRAAGKKANKTLAFATQRH